MEVPMNTQFKEQQCNVAGLALSWIGYAAGLGYFSYQRMWVVARLGMVAVRSLLWRLFLLSPRSPRFLAPGGRGPNSPPFPPPHANPRAPPVPVNFYSFFSCPFCPIVLARLQALQKQMG